MTRFLDAYDACLPRLLRRRCWTLLGLSLLVVGCASDSGSAGPAPFDGGTIDATDSTAGRDAGPDVTPDVEDDASPETGGPDAGDASMPACVPGNGAFPRDLELPAAEVNGAFDPNLARDPSSARLWVAYSGVTGPAGSGFVSTHLAYSDDNGETWCEAGTVNASEAVAPEDQPSNLAQSDAHWNHETAAIVHDPGAPVDARWRLIWHRYLHIEDNDPSTEDDRHFEHGWIAQRKAKTAEGLLAAPESKLFSARAYHLPGVESYNESAVGGSPGKSFAGDPDLGDCLVLAEPGIIANDGSLFVAMFCGRDRTQQDIVLVKLDHHTDSWSYVGTLLRTQDAIAISPALIGFNAADLVARGAEHRLIVSPTSEAYLGCIVYEVNLAAGTVSAPVHAVPKHNDVDVYQTGACTYDEDSVMGLVVGDTHLTGVQFRLSATGDALP